MLHELTHQVHSLFPPEDLQRIVVAYHAARVREDGGSKTFLSRYQQSSVEEYLAEGANAYYTPRRDAYDTREVVRERLLERDSTLVGLVENFTAGPNLAACYAVGLVNAAENAVERENTGEALELRATGLHARSEKRIGAEGTLARLFADRP